MKNPDSVRLHTGCVFLQSRRGIPTKNSVANLSVFAATPYICWKVETQARTDIADSTPSANPKHFHSSLMLLMESG